MNKDQDQLWGMRIHRSDFLILLFLPAGIALSLMLTSCMQPPIMLAQARPPISPHDVWFYVKPNWPRHYELLARLDTTALGGYSSLGTECIVLEKLQSQAARIGANAILLKDPPASGADNDGDGDNDPDMDASPMGAWGVPESPMGQPFVPMAAPTYQGYAAYSPKLPSAHALRIAFVACRR